jgi:hypothetical protein
MEGTSLHSNSRPDHATDEVWLFSSLNLCGSVYLCSLHYKLLASLHVLGLYLVWFCIWCVVFLLILCIQLCLFDTSCICSCCLWVSCFLMISYLALSEWLMKHPISGECHAFVSLFPSNLCTWVLPLSIDILRLPSHYVLCDTHEKFNF